MGPGGFEPPTSGLVVRGSVPINYGPKWLIAMAPNLGGRPFFWKYNLNLLYFVNEFPLIYNIYIISYEPLDI